ncbi:MAG: bifunctional phosphoribosyl-AMP cyclohydrolase/phosphoribosyl-ATP diphosphatase HisIE [Candidatus Burarchaeum sp.]|nr:bifunctional phosphoribosyl-AMP cyclohydrolase/phosphoribosyl-ATP diphosphatase HisIE [Candidatus Burarchaeum sp.]MDO8339191.1 bifunctional phosphoribosyl-AMP cyclohydrolase/phosphoribosyl-ATP diphosphatase HisIE [Candidatus Burarchaeum sp.]
MKLNKRAAVEFAKGMDFKKQGGLVPAIVRTPECEVLMLAYMNQEALMRTLTTGKMWYYSRSRRRLWRKGEESGNTQKLLAVAKDCDCDSLLFTVEQKGPACHTGNKTCFFPTNSTPEPFSLAELFSLIEERKKSGDKKSYTRRLLDDKNLLSSKIYEESAELVEASRKKEKKEVVWEAADLLYHMFVLLASKNVCLGDIERELARRRKEK